MFRHSVCRWPFATMPLSVLAQKAAGLGVSGIGLLHPHEVDEIKPYGLICPVTAAPEDPSGIGSIENAFNDRKNHNALSKIYQKLIREASEAGIPQVICFSGNRNGISDEEGLKNCVDGLAPLVWLAEEHDIILTMELLNSKIDHPDYQCDNTRWGVALCEKLKSNHFKLLYDIYHMQIMEGNIISTIRKYHSFISHYHTAGVPGRNEINDDQELNYPAIIRAIQETGFTGYIAQEFLPRGADPFVSLEDSIKRCSLEDELQTSSH